MQIFNAHHSKPRSPAQEGTSAGSYTGPATEPLLERLTLRTYTRDRSLLVDRWLQYRDEEFIQ